MKIGLVYTSTTPELIDTVNQEVRKQIGTAAELLLYQDPSILTETREAGYVTPAAAGRLFRLYLDAIDDGADAILNICSSVGEAADSVQAMAGYIGCPIVRIDEEMCREAVRLGHRIAVLATLPTTLEPTKQTIFKKARELGRQVTCIDGLIDGAFGIDQEQFKALLCQKALELKDQADVILLCQGSMAYCESELLKVCEKPVLSSPRFGALALREALVRKGLKGDLSC